MMHALDARTGIEVYAFIPFNLLAKLQALPDGNAIGSPDFFVDSSPKLADVRIGTAVATCAASAATCWRTYLFFGEGPGGTFYQALDVTLDDMGSSVDPVTGTTAQVLAYFADGSKVKFRWSFPHYNDFDYTLAPYGDIKSTASTAAKSVGETWSDPAVGQIAEFERQVRAADRLGILSGQQAGRRESRQRGRRARRSISSTSTTGRSSTARMSATTARARAPTTAPRPRRRTARRSRTRFRRTSSRPVLPDSRYITKAYVGDLDGNVWRFDFAMVSGRSERSRRRRICYAAGRAHPLFASMATVNVGSTQQYIFFGTGSDLLPSAGIPSTHSYKLMSVLDSGSVGHRQVHQYAAEHQPHGSGREGDRVPGGRRRYRVLRDDADQAEPAVPTCRTRRCMRRRLPAGSATRLRQARQGTGAILTVTGARATAPFIVDQHVAFGFGNKVEMLGDQNDYNNGVGQVGVRILSWRDVR